MATLKYPRLELRWRNTNKSDGKYSDYEWACDYMIVIAPPSAGDCRSNKGDRYAAQAVEYKLNTTYRTGSIPPSEDNMPFRDGAHIMWDAVALNLPAYVKYAGKRKVIKIKKVRDQIRSMVLDLKKENGHG